VSLSTADACLSSPRNIP